MEAVLDYLRQGFAQQGQTAAQSIAPLTAQILVAIVVFFATRLVAAKTQASVARAMALARADAHSVLLASRSARIGVWCVGGLMILGTLGVGWTAVAAALGLVGLAITVSFQDVLKNFVAGVYLLLERPFRIGDRVRVKDFTGVVEDVGLRTTSLRTGDGAQVIIPNATIFVEVVVNSGPSGERIAANDQIGRR
ncbi:MAG: mechanosensitive ion channel family protein [Chloroflexi bacterium]|nr:mechanosensitive ion channel family protein [Chloroflexota bacterium]